MTHLIRQMGHVAIATPDPAGSAADLADIVGLKVTDRRDDRIFLSSNQRHHEVTLIRSEAPGVLAVGLEAIDAAAVDEVTRRAVSENLEILDEKPLGPYTERAVRIVLPFGSIVEVHTPVRRSEGQRHIGPGARARRIEHVNLKAPDVLVLKDVFTKLFGMQLSDRTAGDEFNWFRCHDGYHHTLAVFRGEPGLHHYAFDFHALEDLAGMADTLVLKDRALLWGPGRHGAGGNVFQYYVDPNNCVVEMSVGMDRIENDELYEARTWAISEGLADRWINQWGSPPPATFTDPGLPFVRTVTA
ncbi:VOC family protein [Marinivivus vitaminiproducens]|uniref:VOC family protein n=1 Tax=Marinivivus vitaminiproducens TaxID=3035935 RepID=UPI00279D33DF|nr:VOC family protein [Geminicoccaceae bacterium SCSIO 64248]